MNATYIDFDRRKLGSLALIPFSLSLIVILTVLNIRTATDPPFLLTILNTLFIGIIPLVIAIIAFRSYRSSGSASLFMMGSGMMIFGTGSIAAGWVIGLTDGTNISVAVYNVCIFISAVFYLTGALLTFTGSKTAGTAGLLWKIAAITSGIVIFVVAFTSLTIMGSIPPFFIVGTRPTILRQIILSYAIAILAITSLVLFRLFTLKREDFFFWYSVSLAVIAIGLVAAFLTPSMGSPVNWVSRGMQYMGAGYALVAIVVASRLAQDRGLSLEETLSRFFSEAEAGYKTLVETATDAIVVFDQDYRIIIWNTSAEKMFGYTKDEAIGLSFTRLLSGNSNDNGNGEVIFTSGKLSGKTKPDILCCRKDGSTFLAELALSRHTVSGVMLSTCIIRDMTERIRAEDHMRFQANLLSNISDVVYATDMQMRLTAWNAAAEKIYGWKEEEVLGKPVFEFVGSKFDPGERARLTQELMEKGRVTAQVEHTTKTGNRIVFDSVTMLLRDADGKVNGFIGVNHDITEQKQAEDALRESEKRFRAIFEHSPFGIATCDLNGRLLATNSAFESMLGYTMEELGNRHFSEFTDPVDIDNEQQIFMEEQADGHDSREFEKHYIRKDGRIIIVRLVGTFIRGLNGEPSIGLVMIEDVTDRRQTEEALKRSLAEKEALLSEVHHRVKNNLAAFISLLSLEGATEESPAGKMLRQDLQNRARSMALIHETLYRTHQYSEVEMDVYLNNLVGQIVNSYISPQSIRIVIEAHGISLDLARATPAGLIVNELVTNSLKHAFPKEAIGCRADQKDPCTIGIRLAEENGSYLLDVFDNGIGMRAGIDPLTSKSLGLKLVTFLAKHQLRATIEVNTGKGTEFMFRFKH